MTRIAITLWGTVIGAAQWVPDRRIAVFQYMRDFAQSGIEIAPLQMPLSTEPYEFPSLSGATFQGLPGLLEDSLPDRYGNQVLNVFFAAEGRIADEVDPLERLGYIEKSGMGALAFEGERRLRRPRGMDVDVAKLASLSRSLGLLPTGAETLADESDIDEDLLRTGIYAGGAKPKAILLYNEETGAFRTEAGPLPDGFVPWLIKFDGGAEAPRGNDLWQFGRIEYAYHLMARAAGIEMTDCTLFAEGDRRHFMTRRFDRRPDGDRLHMQSLGALAHYDYNRPGAHSYEQGVQVLKRLGLPKEDVEQFVLRAFFNILARNQDDHVKNIAFVMDRKGQWRLSPAFDMMYAYDPTNRWTSVHQMSLSGKRDGFERDDLLSFAVAAGFKKRRGGQLLDQAAAAVARWRAHAEAAEIDPDLARRIEASFRLPVLARATSS